MSGLLLSSKQPSCIASNSALRRLPWWERFVIKKGQNPFLTEQHLKNLFSFSFSKVSIFEALHPLVLPEFAHPTATSSHVLLTAKHASDWLLIILNFGLCLFLLDFIFNIVNTKSKDFLKLISLVYLLRR